MDRMSYSYYSFCQYDSMRSHTFFLKIQSMLPTRTDKKGKIKYWLTFRPTRNEKEGPLNSRAFSRKKKPGKIIIFRQFILWATWKAAILAFGCESYTSYICMFEVVNFCGLIITGRHTVSSIVAYFYDKFESWSEYYNGIRNTAMTDDVIDLLNDHVHI